MPYDTFGWELLYKHIEDKIRNKRDVIVAFLHWNFVKNNILCLGEGEDCKNETVETASELLPNNWSAGSSYNLRYVYKNKPYLLNVIFSDDAGICNLLNKTDLKVFSLAIDVDSCVEKINGSIEEIIPNHQEFTYKILQNLIGPITDKVCVASGTQTDEIKKKIDFKQQYGPVRYRDPVPPPPPRFMFNPENDLNPFAGEGGMFPAFPRPGMMPRRDFVGPPDYEAFIRAPPRINYDELI